MKMIYPIKIRLLAFSEVVNHILQTLSEDPFIGLIFIQCVDKCFSDTSQSLCQTILYWKTSNTFCI